MAETAVQARTQAREQLTLLRYHASANVMHVETCFLEPQSSHGYNSIIRGPPLAYPRTLVANQGSRAHYRKAPQTRGCIDNMQWTLGKCGFPYSHSPSGSTRWGTARKGAHTAQKFKRMRGALAGA